MHMETDHACNMINNYGCACVQFEDRTRSALPSRVRLASHQAPPALVCPSLRLLLVILCNLGRSFQESNARARARTHTHTHNSCGASMFMVIQMIERNCPHCGQRPHNGQRLHNEHAVRTMH